MQTATQSTSQGGGAASRGSLEHSTVTGHSHGEQASQALSPHREESEIDDFLGDSPKYDQDEGEGFATATGFDTDRASQVSGHGGGKQNRQ